MTSQIVADRTQPTTLHSSPDRSSSTDSTLGVEPLPFSEESLWDAWQKVRRELLAKQVHGGYWTGQLSTSALSTATAVSALSLVRQFKSSGSLSIFSGTRYSWSDLDNAIETGCRWLLQAQNDDGGFGDTDRSYSNIATSYLAVAAWHLAGFQSEAGRALERAQAYCQRRGGWDGLRQRYGVDKTFVVPILTNCAFAGLASWDDIPALPFEAAWLPQSWYRLARMPVVSYAIPALVAIGQARFLRRPPRNPLIASIRRAAIAPTLAVLAKMQPASGGYLEAVPLTSFVLMSLAGTDRASHPVAQHGLRFLLDSRLSDGSWPIDTNLATWTTSLSISALANQPRMSAPEDREMTISREIPAINATTIRWLLSCQHLSPHPFTGAQPGGWGWSNLSGAVPDADDTPAALLALAKWLDEEPAKIDMLKTQISRAAALGLRWLIWLQNRDGGWPTFCRGWGKLPFDRSGSDLTAHAIRALDAWKRHWHLIANQHELPTLAGLDKAIEKGFEYLVRKQQADGSWIPLWFGNQDHAGEDNPVYGTGRVLLAFSQVANRYQDSMHRGVNYLVKNQNPDGGWGGGKSVSYRVAPHPATEPGSTIEETGIALEALLASSSQPLVDPTIMRGLGWMIAAVQQEHTKISSPIGFYFAKLWYHEQLYPLITATAALGSAVEKLAAVR